MRKIYVYENDERLILINKIKSTANYIGSIITGKGVQELYKANWVLDTIYIQLFLNKNNEYYDCIYWRTNKEMHLVSSLWSVGNVIDFYNNVYNIEKLKYVEYSRKTWGQTKYQNLKNCKI